MSAPKEDITQQIARLVKEQMAPIVARANKLYPDLDPAEPQAASAASSTVAQLEREAAVLKLALGAGLRPGAATDVAGRLRGEYLELVSPSSPAGGRMSPSEYVEHLKATASHLFRRPGNGKDDDGSPWGR